MRFLPLAVTSPLLLAAAMIACSSSDPGIEDEDAGTEQEEEDSGSSPDPIDTPEEDAAAPVNDAAPDTAEPFDANFDAGVLCQPSDTKETEANDTPETADLVAGIPSTYCGRLAAGESDYLTFTLNAAQFTSAFNFSNAPITVTATVEGQSFDLDSNDYIYMQGKTYVLKVTSAGATDYRLQLLP